MANQYINVYKGSPTAGAKDGTLVSSDGSGSSPVEFNLDAATSTTQILSLAIRTENGYQTKGITIISDKDDINDRLKLCWTEDGEYTDSISTAEAITSVNKLFYAKASVDSQENPQTDTSAKFVVDCVIESVT